MNYQRRIRQLNELLGRELGRNEFGHPLYKWVRAEELKHAMRVKDKLDYKADPQSGLIVAHPVYEERLMAPQYQGCWILARWMPAPSEAEWRAIFGYSLEWPRNGQYVFTNVDLDRGVEPNEALTQAAIESIRQHRSKSGEQVAREATDLIAARESAGKQRLQEEIREELTTFDHVPGRRDAVSYPAIVTQ